MEITYHLNDIEEVAKNVVKQLDSVVLLYGNLGAGKTTLVKAMVKALGGDAETSSPTFALVNAYETPNGNVYHLDLYRIESEEEALDIGVEEYLYRAQPCFIEWPQVILELVPERHSVITIDVISEEERRLKIINYS